MSTSNILRKANRHSLDIARDILLVASVRARKTRIMYQANLSFVQVKKYLHNLLEKNLLRHDGDSCYLITKKGQEFLKLYDKYVEQSKKLRDSLDQNEKERLMLEQMCSGSNHGCKIERVKS